MRTSRSLVHPFASHYFTRLRMIAVGLLGSWLLLVSVPAQAQDVQVSVSVGGTSSSFHGDASVFAGRSFVGTELPAQFSGRRTGFQVGVGLRAELTDWIAARTALHYVQQGGVVDRELLGPADGPVNETATFEINYITVPLLAEVHLPRVKATGLRPSVYAGPAIGFNLWSKAKRDYRTVQSTFDFTSDLETPDTVVSIVSGVEVAYLLATGGEVTLDMRYSRGVTDVVAEPGSGDVHVGSVQVGLGYVFPW